MGSRGTNYKPGGRSSPRLDSMHQHGADKAIDSAQLTQLVMDIKKQNDTIIDNQERCLKRMEQNTTDIKALQTEAASTQGRVAVLEEQLLRMDQYSRKSVMILTGLKYTEEESQAELEGNVLNILNNLLGKPGGSGLAITDFAAIHRNGRFMRNNRPPSVTVKFLRYYEKDEFYSRRLVTARKTKYPDLRLHHCMAPGYIEMQKLMSNHPAVKFVLFEGCARLFSVCIKGDENKSDYFINRVQSFEHLQSELDKMSK